MIIKYYNFDSVIFKSLNILISKNNFIIFFITNIPMSKKMEKQLIFNKYRVINLIYSSGFSFVYEGFNEK